MALVFAAGANTIVQGNFIGTDVTGIMGLGNDSKEFDSAGGNIIGGNAAA